MVAASSVFAMPGDVPYKKSYTCTLKKITALPIGARAIKKFSDQEMVALFAAFKKQSIKLPYHIADNTVVPDSGYQAKVYKGDFSNQGVEEYLFDSEGGSGHYDMITQVYRLENKNFKKINFEKVLADNNLQQEGGFYSHLAKPFAYELQGKTYIRFMDYPAGHTNYDPAQLHVYTYFWQGNKLTKISQRDGKDVLKQFCQL